MARIRTIKPEFFRHEELFEAELAAGLPLRLAFAGLWTVADRAGRFKWRPRSLKLECLPYDDVDFSRVLDALTTRGWIVRYVNNGEEFGCIPSWDAHQVINNREQKSILPALEDSTPWTREARVDDASSTPLVQVQVEGKGREGKGKEGEGTSTRDETIQGLELVPVSGKPAKARQNTSDRFAEFWNAYPNTPRRVAKAECVKVWERRQLDVVADDVIAHVRALCSTSDWMMGYEPAPLTFLNRRYWEDGTPVDAQGGVDL